MIDDLKIIKKLYGEKTAHLCRELFPTILETPGKLSNLLQKLFEPQKYLGEDVLMSGNKEAFKNYILGYTDIKPPAVVVDKTPKELLSIAGYDLYECKIDEEVQTFKKYYTPGEALCTFDDNRTARCHVFFAVKRGAEKLNRKDFHPPRRQDEYGTSVISIQFSKGKRNVLSIKNRYNHSVTNPDATFSNNLDNIIPGLTESFKREYNFNWHQNSSDFEIPGYVDFEGKKYKYNCESNNVYYCTNNLIIDQHYRKIIRDYQQMERYLFIDSFILDLQNKRFINYEKSKEVSPRLRNFDPFLKGLKNIKDLKLVKDKKTGNKTLYIKTNGKEIVEIEINKHNQLIKYKNNNLKKLEKHFLSTSEHIMEIEANKVIKIGEGVLGRARNIEKISLEQVYFIDKYFLKFANNLRQVILPKYFFISDGCFGWDATWDEQVIGVKNSFVKKMSSFSLTDFPMLFLPEIIRSTTKSIVRATNFFSDKTELTFQDENVKITSIKKSSKFSKIIKSITSIDEPVQELTEEKGKTK